MHGCRAIKKKSRIKAALNARVDGFAPFRGFSRLHVRARSPIGVGIFPAKGSSLMNLRKP